MGTYHKAVTLRERDDATNSPAQSEADRESRVTDMEAHYVAMGVQWKSMGRIAREPRKRKLMKVLCEETQTIFESIVAALDWLTSMGIASPKTNNVQESLAKGNGAYGYHFRRLEEPFKQYKRVRAVGLLCVTTDRKYKTITSAAKELAEAKQRSFGSAWNRIDRSARHGTPDYNGHYWQFLKAVQAAKESHATHESLAP